MPGFRIAPAKEFSSIKEALGLKGRTAVLCTIINLNPEELSAIASDSFGEAKLLFETKESFKKARVGELARVFGNAFQENNNVLINVESIQSFDNIDLKLYTQVKGLEARFKVV